MRHALLLATLCATGWLALAGSARAQADADKPAATRPAESEKAGAAAAGAASAPADRKDAAAPGTPGKDAVAKDAAAKDAAAKPAPPAAGGASVKVERTATGAKLFRITEGMLVEGQMQKPNAFYVLQRATIDYDFEALSESFLPRIHAATKKPPF
ncbi:MAG: hypothetical protein U1A78_35960 [Polyangia bacterium]